MAATAKVIVVMAQALPLGLTARSSFLRRVKASQLAINMTTKPEHGLIPSGIAPAIRHRRELKIVLRLASCHLSKLSWEGSTHSYIHSALTPPQRDSRE